MPPPNEHEAADAMLVGLLDRVRKTLKKKGYDDEDIGPALRVLTMALHTQVMILKQRPDMVLPYLDQLEALMIETGIGDSAGRMRELAEKGTAELWAQVDEMHVERGKFDA